MGRSGMIIGAIALLATVSFATLRAQTIHQIAVRGDMNQLNVSLKNNPALINARDSQGATPLYVAASNGQAQSVRLLIARGADVNVKTTDGLTPIHWAALNGHYDVVRLLLDAGALADEQSTVQWNTPLIETWSGNRADVAELLLGRGARVNAVERWFGWTTLHFAAWRCHLQLMGVLIAHNADPNLRDLRGQTPLHIAAAQDCPDAVRMLLDAGANPAAVDNDGLRPVQRARDAEIVRLISEYKPPVVKPTVLPDHNVTRPDSPVIR